VRTGRKKKKKKREKMKNKTSIKYMRGPWRGGNLPFIRAKEEKKKKNTLKTPTGRPHAFRDVRRHPRRASKKKGRKKKKR